MEWAWNILALPSDPTALKFSSEVDDTEAE